MKRFYSEMLMKIAEESLLGCADLWLTGKLHPKQILQLKVDIGGFKS